MKVTGSRPKIVAAADGRGVVGHARLTQSARQTWLRIAETWPWATDLAAAFTRLNALPQPIR